MAARLHKGWLIACVFAVLLGAVLLWAWNDGGMRPVSEQVVQVNLPQVKR